LKDFLKDFQKYVVASRINVAPGMGQAAKREEALDNLVVANLNAVCEIGTRNEGNQISSLNTAEEFHNACATKIGRIGVEVATIALNTAGGFPAITIAPGIKLGQLISLFRTLYTIIEHLKQMAVFGQLMQRNMSIGEFSA
ncbi:2747_t:CDS:2, partial [Cetraspora pellucida]